MPGSTLAESIALYNTSVKAMAMDTNYSDDAYYMAIKGKRRIPQEVCKINALAGLAKAMEVTGYKIFRLITGDRHIQTMIQRVFKEDSEADKVIKELPFMLIDKTKPEHLTNEEREFLRKVAAKELFDRIRSDLNLLIFLDTTYELNLVEELTEKEKGTQKERQ